METLKDKTSKSYRCSHALRKFEMDGLAFSRLNLNVLSLVANWFSELVEGSTIVFDLM